jgi:peptide/nickel transport system substrate-binding protein
MLLSGVICLLGITSALAITYNEAPMLRTKVATGLLPPIEERLPLEPKILSAKRNEVRKGNLDFEIGHYGGVLRSVRPGPDWNPDIFVMNDEPLLSAPGILAKGIEGNVLKGFEVSEDGKIFTFYMREGLKWSDGVPVTSEDVLFTYEDFLLNEKVTPTFPRWMRSANKADGEPLKLEVIDKYTFRISNFHIRYTPLEKLEPLINEEELAKGDWWTLFNMEDILNWELTNRRAVGFPTLNPWMLVEVTPTVFTYERNPYYFKVDTEGNQLPYIDGIRDDLVAEVEMSTMKVLAGEVDFLREDATLESLALYKENEETGGYRVVLLDMHVDPVNLHFNQTYPDPVWCEVIRDVRLRKALTLATNREEIIDAVYFGFAKPSELVPSEYDPEAANRLLDEMGLNKRDAEGYRLGPDGKTFVIPFEIAKHAADIVPVTELAIEHWKKVGIKATIKTIDPGLWDTRAAANDLKATAMWNHAPLWWGFGGPFGQGDIDRFDWPLWWDWYDSGGRIGEEPLADVKRFLDLRSVSVMVSPEKSGKIVDEFFHLMHEKVFFVQLVTEVKYPLIVSKRLGNVPHKGFAITANFAGEQLFFRR